jgi:hypothetical protein
MGFGIPWQAWMLFKGKMGKKQGKTKRVEWIGDRR